MRGVQTGSSHTNNVRLYDVMAHGCVPIIVSDDFQPPLDKLLPWKEIPEGFRATPAANDKSMTLCLIQEVYTNFSSIDVGNLHMNCDQVLFFGAHIWDYVASLAEHEHGPSVDCMGL